MCILLHICVGQRTASFHYVSSVDHLGPHALAELPLSTGHFLKFPSAPISNSLQGAPGTFPIAWRSGSSLIKSRSRSGVAQNLN